jgi:hypothetical protein
MGGRRQKTKPENAEEAEEAEGGKDLKFQI